MLNLPIKLYGLIEIQKTFFFKKNSCKFKNDYIYFFNNKFSFIWNAN